MKKIAIIGAGPGGLAAGMVLSKDYEVHIYEKDLSVGGRSKKLSFDGYHFDVGPTFLMYIDVLKSVFNEAGYNLEKELELIKLDQLYTLKFNDVTFNMSADMADNIDMYDQYQKGLGKSYQTWFTAQEKKFKKLIPILNKPFPNFLHFFRKDVLSAAFYVHPLQSVYRHLSTFNKNENFIHSLSFQAKYLGMSSYEAPSIFTILPYLEHGLGLYHVKGGLNQINHKMAELIEKNGGHIHLDHKVEKINVENKRVKSIIINGEEHLFDQIVLNADFAYAMSNLIEERHLRKYKNKKLMQKRYSVSTFMMYIGLDKTFDFAHHEIIFSKDYKAYLNTLTSNKYTKDISVYIHNPSLIDDSYAKKGHSSLFVLVPVPNVDGTVDWPKYERELKNTTLDLIEKAHQIDLRSHIKAMKTINPEDWQENYNVYKGAVFNLAHNLGQMLHKRPQNKFEEIDGIYLVGGGTHPGSGLPTIYQSALILKYYL